MKRDFVCNVLRSVQSVKGLTLFNLEGAEKRCTLSKKKDQDGPIAQMARAHD